jgi:hypothetical protein
MATYNIDGVKNGIDQLEKDYINKADDVQSAVDDPNRNESDLYQDILTFTEALEQKNVGSRIMLGAMKQGFTIDESILQEIK